MTVKIDGKTHGSLVSCHRDGTFSYYDGKAWVTNVRKVPGEVVRTLPVEEIARVNAHLHAFAGGAR